MQKQTKILNEEIEYEKNTKIEEFIKNPVALFFLYDIQIISFILANFSIFIIMNHFFLMNVFSAVNTFLFGTFLSLLIIKTYYFLDLNSAIKRILEFFHFVSDRDKLQSIKSPKVNLTELIGFTLRNLFFNLLNDFFIVLIYWIVLFAIFIWIGWIKQPDDFTLFFQTISLIGIISGLFQIYIKDYKEKSAVMLKSLIDERLSILRKISLKDFQIFLVRKNKDQFVEAIQKVILQKDVLLQENFGLYRARYQIVSQFLILPRIINSNSVNGFIEFEMHLQTEHPFNTRELHFQYEQYFNEKRNLIKTYNTEKNIQELRKVLFSTIIFSDELSISIMRFSSDLPRKIEEPMTFIDFYSNFQRACIYDLFYQILYDKN